MTDKKKANQKASPKNTHGHYTTPAPIGNGFTVRFRKRKDGSIQAQWSPRMPSAHELNQMVSTLEYKLALLAFLAGEVRP